MDFRKLSFERLEELMAINTVKLAQAIRTNDDSYKAKLMEARELIGKSIAWKIENE